MDHPGPNKRARQLAKCVGVIRARARVLDFPTACSVRSQAAATKLPVREPGRGHGMSSDISVP